MRLFPLHADLAAEIEGVAVRADLPEEDLSFLRDALRRFGVLVFRNQLLTDEDHIAFAARFGKVETASNLYTTADEARLTRPELSDVSNLDSAGKPRKSDDLRRLRALGNRLWHADGSFKPVIGALSMLYGRSVPNSGGDTEFADMRVAYDMQPPAMQGRLATLWAEHSYVYSRTQLGFTNLTPEQITALPPSRHPLVRVHGPSGRKSLYLGAHASHIIGLPVPEGRMLLRDLLEDATARELVHAHKWEPNDFLIWDNRCVVHRARAFDESQARDLRRVTTLDAAEEEAGRLPEPQLLRDAAMAEPG